MSNLHRRDGLVVWFGWWLFAVKVEGIVRGG